MTDPNAPGPDPLGDLPPDLPPEYAEAYRRGYQRAWDTSHDEIEAQPSYEYVFAEPEPEPEPSLEDDLLGDVEPAPWTGPTYRHDDEVPKQPRWIIPALLGVLVLALVLSAYGVGKLFSDDELDPPRDAVRVDQPNATPQPKPTPVTGTAWEGPVRPLSGVRGTSSCVMPPGTDAAGRRVSYEPDRALDGDFTTAWRCAGNGRGVTLRLTLLARLRLAEVGLVPGYAKTDPQSRVDRYAENNRITRVRWTFDDGRSVVQRLDGTPTNRRVQTLRVPPVETETVTLELLSSVRGPRNTVAISEVQLSEAVG